MNSASFHRSLQQTRTQAEPKNSVLRIWILAVALALGSRQALAEKVVAVLSSDTVPYQEALAGLEEGLGEKVQTIRLSKDSFETPADGTIVVAFGGKAALEAASSYDGPVIYTLAPGIKISSQEHPGTLLKIHTSPAVPAVVQHYKELNPAIRRVAVLWIGDSIKDYFEQKSQIEVTQGVELQSVRLRSLTDLPTALRDLKGKTDAIWMPPDAALITPQSFAAVREFARAQHIAFFAPSDALVEKGATAAAYTTFRELGRLAGVSAKKVRDDSIGKTQSIFPEQISFAVNLTAAAESGLKVPAGVLQKAEKVIQ